MTNIAVLSLTYPQDLPKSYKEMNSRLTDDIVHALTGHLRTPIGRSGKESLFRVSKTLCMLPQREFPAAATRGLSAMADSDAHDDYCRIRRVKDTGSLRVFVTAILQAYRELLEDANTGGSLLRHQQWKQLLHGFETLLTFVGGGETRDVAIGDWNVDFDWAPVLTCPPLGRWVRGHHVFLVLIQGLIVSLNCFRAAVAAGETRMAAQGLDLAKVLMNGSSAALHYAADFAPEDYDQTVRPTMMPPNVPPGMSGVLARDHKHLVKLLQCSRTLFSGLEPVLESRFLAFAAAFSGAYESHKLVCAHFRGGERPSLLQGGGEQSGVEMLEELKQSRLKCFLEDRVASEA